MRERPWVFVDVDTQRDFLEPNGALYVTNSAQIVPNLGRLTRLARAGSIPVLATACAHTPSDPELTRFPPHCLIGSPGARRVPATEWPESVVLGPTDRLPPDAPIPPHVTLLKRELDLLSHPEADRLIRAYGKSDPLFVVYGVATDYCIACTVVALLDRGQRVAIVADAIRAIDPTAEPAILAQFLARGASLVATDVICGD
jgi:nicotinamidase/pyrazinamidase